jgi:hypothetical protein
MLKTGKENPSTTQANAVAQITAGNAIRLPAMPVFQNKTASPANNLRETETMAIAEKTGIGNMKMFVPRLSSSTPAAQFQKNGVIQYLKLFKENKLADITEAPTGGEWCEYRVEYDVNDLVYVHFDDIVSFMEKYETAELIRTMEEQEKTPEKETGSSSGERDSLEDYDDESLYQEKDISHLIHFDNKKSKQKNTIDPEKQPMDEFDAGNFTNGHLPGQLTTVIFRVPGHERTHFEVMCIATGAREEDPEKYIKFDFTTGGYRMLYAADPERADGLVERDRQDVIAMHIMISDVTGMFASRAYANGKYREGANECSNFARNFFTDITGRDANED